MTRARKIVGRITFMVSQGTTTIEISPGTMVARIQPAGEIS